MWTKKKRDDRLARLEAEAAQWAGEVAAEKAARKRAEEFAAASLQTVERTADQWDRDPQRQGCAVELRSLVARLRGLRDGRVL